MVKIIILAIAWAGIVLLWIVSFGAGIQSGEGRKEKAATTLNVAAAIGFATAVLFTAGAYL